MQNWKDKHMVETQEQAKMGLEHKAFKKDGFIDVHDKVFRICAPPRDATSMQACVFWTKDDPNDNEPTWTKVVSTSLLLLHHF